jgi:hypothetical protein
VVVHFGRQRGKTSALLHAIYERELGQAILIVLNGLGERRMMAEWREMLKDETRWHVHDPKIIATPGAIRSLMGTSDPIYCDEWFQYLQELREALRHSGRVAGAVGTVPNERDDIKVFPL